MDPFLDYSTHKLDRESDAVNEEWAGQHLGHPAKDANKPEPWAWWVGNLMIRIGQKLTRQDTITSSTKRIA